MQAGHEYVYDALTEFINGTSIFIFDAAGQQVLGINPGSNSPIFTATRTGNYTLLAVNSTSVSSHLAWRLLDISTALPLSLNSDVTASFSTGFETDLYQFSGVAGQRLTFDSLSTDGGRVPQRSLARAETQALFVNLAADSGVITLTESGTYTLFASANSGTANASSSFRLLDLAGLPTVAFGSQTDVTTTLNKSPAYIFDGGGRAGDVSLAQFGAGDGWNLVADWSEQRQSGICQSGQ